ncbi:hypothetical protein FQA47_010949 [Oryzias melastigma]|uniref:Uncharacterized protein n=1 Tax=Oryzias melastigma TaxID=30732 RepID=A0A834C5K6_ORYME|nr:hypothetical protein FQA47_010949 [Oryzias melastigma]
MPRMDSAVAPQAKEAKIVGHRVNLDSGAKAVPIDASARIPLWAVIQSTVGVCVKRDTLETNVKRAVRMAVTVWTALSSAGVRTERSATMSAEPAHAHLDSRGHSVKKFARTAFTVLTVARCASAGMVPAATTSQEPACAPLAGQDHTAFWLVLQTGSEQTARVTVSVKMVVPATV